MVACKVQEQREPVGGAASPAQQARAQTLRSHLNAQGRCKCSWAVPIFSPSMKNSQPFPWAPVCKPTDLSKMQIRFCDCPLSKPSMAPIDLRPHSLGQQIRPCLPFSPPLLPPQHKQAALPASGPLHIHAGSSAYSPLLLYSDEKNPQGPPGCDSTSPSL